MTYTDGILEVTLAPATPGQVYQSGGVSRWGASLRLLETSTADVARAAAAAILREFGPDWRGVVTVTDRRHHLPANKRHAPMSVAVGARLTGPETWEF